MRVFRLCQRLFAICFLDKQFGKLNLSYTVLSMNNSDDVSSTHRFFFISQNHIEFVPHSVLSLSI